MCPRKISTLGPSPLRTVMNTSSLSPSRRIYQDSEADTDAESSSLADEDGDGDEDEDEAEGEGDLESISLKAEPVHWEKGMTGELAEYSWLQQAEAAAEAKEGWGGERKIDREGMRKEDEGQVGEMSLTSGRTAKGKKRVSWWDGLFEDWEGSSRDKTGVDAEPRETQMEMEGSGNTSDVPDLGTNGDNSGGGTGSFLEPEARASVLGRRKRREDEDEKDNSRPSTTKKLRSGRRL